MTARPASDPAGAREPRCTDGYERLRLQAVRPGAGPDRCGLAILVRQGVAAWLRSCAELPPAPAAPRPGTAPAAQETEMIDILLAIARQHIQEGTACTYPIAR